VTRHCLISFDRNRYSVAARAVRRAVQVRAYADKIVLGLGDEIIAKPRRSFARNRTINDSWYQLVNKPSALKDGAHPKVGICRQRLPC